MPKHKNLNQQIQTEKNQEQGGTFSPQYTDRKSKILNVPEMELDSLSFANELRTVCFAIATFFAGIIAECLVSPTSENTVYRNFSFVLALIFLVLGVIAWIYRSNIVRNIKNESKLKF